MIHKLGFCWCGTTHVSLADTGEDSDVVTFVEQVCDRRLVPWQRRLLVALTSGTHDLGLGRADVRRRV
jgi:hypothetical protein